MVINGFSAVMLIMGISWTFHAKEVSIRSVVLHDCNDAVKSNDEEKKERAIGLHN